MNKSSLLIEIFTEELPYSAIKKEFGNVVGKFEAILKKYRLDSVESAVDSVESTESRVDSAVDSVDSVADSAMDSVESVMDSVESVADSTTSQNLIKFFYTPRRMIIFIRNLPSKQSDEVLEFFGPPLNIAYQNNEPTNATKSFLSKLNITLDKVQTKQKNGKDCLYFAKKESGKNTINLIENIIDEFLDALSFDKKMRWGSVECAFVRPIRNIFALFGSSFITLPNVAKKYQFTQSARIYPHRNCESKEIKSVEEYFSFLEKNAVIYSQSARKERILEQIKKCGLIVEVDLDLLDEIVAICEYPNVLVGAFDEKFLVLPKEVIVTSMKINQKYFATYKDESLSALNAAFIVVCNALNPSELITQGNVKVLSARLEDALFFYHNDGKNFNAKSCDERLKNIEFIKNGGSLWDKVERENAIAKAILEQISGGCGNFSGCAESSASVAFGASLAKIIASQSQIAHAINIAKNDLLSEMVGEFGELQGIMGGYYAKNAGVDLEICEAIKEQYLAIPSSVLGGIVGIANRLDSIFCLFALGKIPSGSKDPFALRRGASGILKIIEKFNLPLDLCAIFKAVAQNYAKTDIAHIESFFYERMEGVLEVNQSLINAALKAHKGDLLELISKIKALNLIAQSPSISDFKVLFKRVANILQPNILQPNLSQSATLQPANATKIDETLLNESAEKALYEKIIAFQKLNFSTHSERIVALLDFKDCLSTFFDEVLINVEDSRLKANRILLIKAIYEEFFKVGDIKEISF